MLHSCFFLFSFPSSQRINILVDLVGSEFEGKNDLTNAVEKKRCQLALEHNGAFEQIFEQ